MAKGSVVADAEKPGGDWSAAILEPGDGFPGSKKSLGREVFGVTR